MPDGPRAKPWLLRRSVRPRAVWLGFTLLITLAFVAEAAADVTPPPELAAQLAAEGRVALYDIYFTPTKATLTPASEPGLLRIVRLLERDRALALTVEVHSDALGSEEYNLRISQARAEAIVAWLGAHGVAPARLTAVGRGESAPLCREPNPTCRRKNRRVELRRR